MYRDDDVQDYIREFYGPAMLKIYLSINRADGAARADLFRYLLIYREGGVYLDIKSFTPTPLARIIRADDEYLLRHWKTANYSRALRNAYGEFQQWFIIARPRHAFLKAVIERVARKIQRYKAHPGNVGKLGVLRTTGSIAYSEAILPILAKHKHRLLRSGKDEELSYVNSNIFGDHRQLFTRHYPLLTGPICES